MRTTAASMRTHMCSVSQCLGLGWPGLNSLNCAVALVDCAKIPIPRAATSGRAVLLFPGYEGAICFCACWFAIRSCARVWPAAELLFLGGERRQADRDPGWVKHGALPAGGSLIGPAIQPLLGSRCAQFVRCCRSPRSTASGCSSTTPSCVRGASTPPISPAPSRRGQSSPMTFRPFESDWFVGVQRCCDAGRHDSHVRWSLAKSPCRSSLHGEAVVL